MKNILRCVKAPRKFKKSLIKDKATKSSLKKRLKELSYRNTMVYQDLYILENIFREYIKINNISEGNFDNSDKIEKEIIDSMKLTKKFRKEDEERHALKAEALLMNMEMWKDIQQ